MTNKIKLNKKLLTNLTNIINPYANIINPLTTKQFGFSILKCVLDI